MPYFRVALQSRASDLNGKVNCLYLLAVEDRGNEEDFP